MMKNISSAYLTLLLGLFFPFLECFAQQEPLYTQYMFNGLAINPAYAGSHESVSLTVLARNHWRNWNDGAGDTQTFSAHSPLKNERVGLGFLIMRDKLWVTRRINVSGSYAYRIPVSQKAKLSLGLQAGVRTVKIDLSDLRGVARDPDDPILNDVSNALFNFGAGLYYYSDRLYIGLSAPQLINNKFDKGNSDAREERHYFLGAGYVIGNWSAVKFKPNVLFKWVDDAPVTLDLNANFMFFDDKIWAGVSWRSFDSIDFLFEYILPGNNFRVGLALDPFTTTDAKDFQDGSFEVMLNYRFGLNKDVPLTPRYF